MKQPIYSLFLLLLLSLNGSAQSAERLFYSTFSPQDWDIYISKDHGKTITQFTSDPALDYDAVISPDAKWVVFTSERSGMPQLYAQATEGDQTPRLLLQSNSFQDQACFSPDGSQLAFVASHEGNAEIYLLPFLPDSTQPISAAINRSKNPAGDFRPAFSPDGKQLAFSSDRDHEIVPHPQFPFARQRLGDIYTMDVDGTNVKRLSNADAWDGSPVWNADGTRILFYSGRNGQNTLFEMNADGSNPQQVLTFEGPAVSPRYLPNGNLAFTTWNSEQDFKIMQSQNAGAAPAALFDSGLDLMFNLHAHPNGLMVFHGGRYPKNTSAEAPFGFDGNVLAKLPQSLSFANQQLDAFGVRRAFVAPPLKGKQQLVYDAAEGGGFFAFLLPLGYSVFLLPIWVVVLFIAAFIAGIVNRKKVAFWKYIVFAIFTLLIGIITGIIFLYVDTINPLSVNSIRGVMGLLFLLLAALGWWQHKKASGKKEKGLETHRISKLYSLLFFGLAVFAFCCAAFINQFVKSTLHFYEVDYISETKTALFSLEKEPNTNPANFRVLDSKISHDGNALLFTTGSFRGNAGTQGDMWRYDFDSKKVNKLDDAPGNDGFVDISEDGKMVFRSGRTGFFDIYVKTDTFIQNLTNDHCRDNFPAISKQGDKIVFASDRLRKEDEYKTMDIFLMQLEADGTWSAAEKISQGSGQNGHPHFSPDGQWVVYTTEAYGINDEQSLIQPIIFSPQMYGEIVAYHIPDKQLYRLTHNKWEEGTPLWVE